LACQLLLSGEYTIRLGLHLCRMIVSTPKGEIASVRKLMSLMLGLSLTVGSATVVFGQDKEAPPTKDGQEKADKKGKGDKKGKDDKGDKKGKDDKGKDDKSKDDKGK